MELVRELVVLVRGLSAKKIAPAIDAKVELEGVRAHAAADGATFVVHGLPTRVRAVPEREWVHALVVGTGDDAHVAWLDPRRARRSDLASSVRAREERGRRRTARSASRRAARAS